MAQLNIALDQEETIRLLADGTGDAFRKLQVPRHRNAPFNTMAFETCKRSEAAPVTTMAVMVVVGASAAKAGRRWPQGDAELRQELAMIAKQQKS